VTALIRITAKLTDWREVSRIVLHIDAEQEPDGERSTVISRAKWMTEV
jgi:hypothetical protein